MPKNPHFFHEGRIEADLTRWHEAFFGVDVVLLHASPVYYGFGVPRGDNSAVIMIPGFMNSDAYLIVMHQWLKRIGYRPYFSGIIVNAECPNLLIERHLNTVVDKALQETGSKIHVIGHSLGGIIGRALVRQRHDDVASVITLGSPFRGSAVHRNILQVTDMVRKYILLKHGSSVKPTCYTAHCTCDFVDSLRRELPPRVRQTAIYTRHDGVVDWRYCITGDPEIDVEVPGTHSGLPFNPKAYSVIAQRLASSRVEPLVP